MSEKDRLVLQHQMEEWKYLNEYVNKMDTGYQQSIIVLATIFSIGVAFMTSKNGSTIAILVIPPAMIAAFAYISYQFRITAILRGHLSALEYKMNKKIEENVHLWNSALMEVYMAHDNLIVNFMMIPIAFLMIVLYVVCFIYTWQLSINRIVLTVYWILNTVFILITIIPFFYNDRIKYACEDEETVYKKYTEYIRKK